MEKDVSEIVDRVAAYALAGVLVVSIGMTGWVAYHDSPAGFYATKGARVVSSQVGDFALALRGAADSHQVAVNFPRHQLLGSAYYQDLDLLKETLRSTALNFGVPLFK